jgi:hypothetical protein
MPNEQYVQISPDSTGKYVRNLTLQVLGDDGNFRTVNVEVISAMDEFGNRLLWNDEYDWRQQMLDELRAIRLGIQALFNAGAVEQSEDFLENAQALRDTLLET